MRDARPPAPAPLPRAGEGRVTAANSREPYSGCSIRHAEPERKRMDIRRTIPAVAAVVAAFTLLLPAESQAQQAFPSKPIRLIVPNPPGGATDVLARILADDLGRQSKTVVVEDRPGASATTGA